MGQLLGKSTARIRRQIRVRLSSRLRAACFWRSASSGLVSVIVTAAIFMSAQPADAQAAQGKTAAAATAPSLAQPFAHIKSWGYQLRGIDPAKIAASAYDVVVIDFARDDRPFTAAEVATMRTKPDGGRRTVRRDLQRTGQPAAQTM